MNTVDRDFRSFNNDEFQKDLLNIDWDKILSLNDTDTCFNSFYNTVFISLLDEHAPYKTLTKKKKKSLRQKPMDN